MKLAFDGYGDIPLRGPLEVDAVFHLPRPKSNKSKHPVNPPDLDKLERGLWDALTLAGVWEDDAQVVLSHARKRWSQTPGAHVFIIPLDDHKEELDITPQPVLA